eukprot:4925058-Alexandrium_andersonii.AAC.1
MHRLSHTLEPRPAVPLEHVAMQMVPMFLPTANPLTSLFEPVVQCPGGLSGNEIRSLTGNGMNRAAVGSVL